MKTLKLFAATIFLMTVAISGQAQQFKVNDKFGKPTHQELTMVQYDQDPEANAVVLCKIGSVDYDLTGGNAIVIYHFQKRIKVLKDAGSKYANVAIDYYSEPGSDGLHESIEDLSAVAYNIVGGKLIKTKLSNKLVFNERLDKNHFRTKFTIPQVKVGTVIEYDYTIHSNIFFNIRNYIAQEEIPVAYCKYKMEIPTWFYFNVESSIKPYFKGIASQGSFVARLGGNDITPLNNSGKTNIYTFYGYLMPAVKDDPFVWCPDDYAAHVTSELMTYQFPGGTAHTMTKTWDEVDRDILEMDDFGSRLNDKCKFADEIDASGIAGISDFKNKVAAAFSMLMKKVSWDGNYSFIPKSAGEVLKKGSGTNADINMIFISMCNHLGIKACPVVMSTRRNGMLPQNFPSLQKLNTFIVAVTDGKDTDYVDASGKDGYLNILPPDLYAEKARAIWKNHAGVWMNPQNLAKAKELVSIDAILSPDGTYKGVCKDRFVDNAAAARRKDWQIAKDSAAYISQLAAECGSSITKYEVKGNKDFSPEMEETYTFNKKIDVGGDHIYINVFPCSPMGENPFSKPSRDLPVEFPYKSSVTYIVNVTIPKGYTFEEGPQDAVIRTQDNAISGRVMTNNLSGKVTVIYKFNINKMLFTVDKYAAMKELFDKMENISKSMLVFKKDV